MVLPPTLLPVEVEEELEVLVPDEDPDSEEDEEPVDELLPDSDPDSDEVLLPELVLDPELDPDSELVLDPELELEFEDDSVPLSVSEVVVVWIIVSPSIMLVYWKSTCLGI